MVVSLATPSVTVETTLLVSFEAWVGVSDVSIVGHDETVVPLIFNSILNMRSIIGFWYWWKALSCQVLLIVLLGDKQLDLGSNFLTDFNSFRICFLGIERGVFHAGHKLGSLRTF